MTLENFADHIGLMLCVKCNLSKMVNSDQNSSSYVKRDNVSDNDIVRYKQLLAQLLSQIKYRLMLLIVPTIFVLFTMRTYSHIMMILLMNVKNDMSRDIHSKLWPKSNMTMLPNIVPSRIGLLLSQNNY